MESEELEATDVEYICIPLPLADHNDNSPPW